MTERPDYADLIRRSRGQTPLLPTQEEEAQAASASRQAAPENVGELNQSLVNTEAKEEDMDRSFLS